MEDEQLSPAETSRFEKVYRLVVINDESYEEVGSYRLTELNIYLFGSAVFVAVVVLVVLLLVFTPLKNIIPGYGETNALSTKKEIVKVYKHLDSLEQTVAAQNLYLQSVGKALRGEIDASEVSTPALITDFAAANAHLAKNGAAAEPEIPAPANNTNSAKGALVETTQQKNKNKPNFMPPVQKGIVTEGFNAQAGHYGIDIAAPKNTAVQSIGSGTVITADWTLETGFVVGVQHDNNMVSFYKHNTVLFKKVGDKVKQGEAIATIGNTGHLSSGPHLHFELWQDGTPLNPTEYLSL